MALEKSKTYEWLETIPTPLFGVNEIPIFGYPPAFPWEDLSQKFALKFEIEDFTFKATKFTLLKKKDLFKKLGSPLVPLTFSVYPFGGELFFILSKDDILELMAHMVFKDPGKKDLLSDEYEQAFYNFIAAAFIQALNESEFDENIKPAIKEKSSLPDDDMLASDIQISFGKNKFIGRCYISPAIQKSVKKHYIKEKDKAPFKDEMAEKLTVQVHLEAGNVTLTEEEWSKVRPGDFIILDKCSLKPGADKGRVFLTVHGNPMFRGKIKEGNLTILEYPIYHDEV